MSRNADEKTWDRSYQYDECPDCGSEDLEHKSNTSIYKPNYTICQSCGYTIEHIPTG